MDDSPTAWTHPLLAFVSGFTARSVHTDPPDVLASEGHRLSPKPIASVADVLAAPDFESLGKVQDVARLLNVSRSWVHAHKDELPHLRIGGLLRFDLAEVRSWSVRQRTGEVTRLQAEIVRLRGDSTDTNSGGCSAR